MVDDVHRRVSHVQLQGSEASEGKEVNSMTPVTPKGNATVTMLALQFSGLCVSLHCLPKRWFREEEEQSPLTDESALVW